MLLVLGVCRPRLLHKIMPKGIPYSIYKQCFEETIIIIMLASWGFWLSTKLKRLPAMSGEGMDSLVALGGVQKYGASIGTRGIREILS